MAAQHDILDRPESLKNPLFLSVGLHVTLAAAATIYALIPASQVIRWGDPNSLGGGAVSIKPVRSIPLPPRAGRVNPLANDTPSQVPAPPPQEVAKPKPAPPEAPKPVELPGRETARRPPAPQSSRRTRQAPDATRDNQLYSRSGPALTSPMYSTASGGGGVGVGPGNPLGDRFGYYVSILEQRVAEHWDTSKVDPRLQNAPLVIVTFEILRDGSVRGVRLFQGSGHATLDYSAQRAITEASPFPPLPQGFERNSATVEFRFELRR